MVVVFDDQLDDDITSDFCDKLTSCVYSLREGDVVDLFFSTNGGANHNRVPILKLLTKYQDYINIYINNIMVSNGFILLMELAENDVPVYMSKEFTYSMIHKTDALLNNHRPIGYEPNMNKYIKKYNLDVSNRLKKLGLTDEQLILFNKGSDVYFTPEQTLKIFPNIIKIKK